MRVLAVTPGFGPDGGAERSIEEMAPELLRRGVRLHLAVLSPRQGLVPSIERAGVVVHDLSAAAGLVSRVRAIRTITRSVEPSLVHASLYDAALASQLAVLGTGVPVLVTWANSGYGDAASGEAVASTWKLEAIRWSETVLGRLSGSWYHAVTPAVGRIVGSSRRADPGRVLVGRRGRSPERFSSTGPLPDPETLPALPSDARVVLAVGRQDTQKGYEDLLSAFNSVAERHAGAHLLVVGRPGSASARIEETMRSLRHADRVHLLGQRDDVPALLRRADVIACASWREGAAGALIEAFAAGVPVVSVRIAGLDGELVQGVNSLVVPREQLAAAISEVLDDTELARRLTAGGLRTFQQQHTTQAAAARMVEIYRTVASG